MTDHFKPLEHDMLFLMPPSIQDWLPQNHLAKFVVEIVSKLDVRPIHVRYAGRGSAAYQPEMLVALLFYGYASGICSSRKLERATYELVPFRYIAANQHPEHDTISDFRKRFLEELSDLFEQILVIAAESDILKIGRASIDGTKVKANASKHHALSYAGTQRLKKHIRKEVERLLRMAEEADATDVPDAFDLPAELSSREARLQAIEEAQKRIRAREEQRIAAEQAEHRAKVEARHEKERQTGKKPPGPKPKPPSRKINPQAQINLTDEDSRIMPTSGGGFEQAYNAQAGVECESRLIVAADASQHPIDKTLLVPMVTTLRKLPKKLGQVKELLADAGFCSRTNVEQCIALGIQPYISAHRISHFEGLKRFRKPQPPKEGASAFEHMRYILQTQAGQAIYGLPTVEPVFGIIKSAMGFRQFHLRSHEKVRHEWKLVCSAYNIRRMFTFNGFTNNSTAMFPYQCCESVAMTKNTSWNLASGDRALRTM